MSDQNAYAPQHAAPAPAKKSRKKWIIGGAVVAALAVFGIATNGGDDENTGNAAPSATSPAPNADANTGATPATEDAANGAEATPAADGHTLTFRASTSDGSTGSVTYLGADMNITQRQDEPMPWSVDLPGIDNKWDALGANVSVQQSGSGEVTCEVLWDGETVATNTSAGPYAVASCSLPSDL